MGCDMAGEYGYENGYERVLVQEEGTAKMKKNEATLAEQGMITGTVVAGSC